MTPQIPPVAKNFRELKFSGCPPNDSLLNLAGMFGVLPTNFSGHIGEFTRQIRIGINAGFNHLEYYC